VSSSGICQSNAVFALTGQQAPTNTGSGSNDPSNPAGSDSSTGGSDTFFCEACTESTGG